MARISIVHTTEYGYRNPVGLTRHRMMIRPDDSHDLQLHRASLAVEPAPSAIRWAHDVFNNSICVLEWPEALRTQRLSIVSTLDLTHHPVGAAAPAYSLEPGAELFPFSYASVEIPDLARLAERQEPDPDGRVDAWARRFVSGAGEIHTLKMIEAMTARHQGGLPLRRAPRGGNPDRSRYDRAWLRHLPRFRRAHDGSLAQLRPRRAFCDGISLR